MQPSRPLLQVGTEAELVAALKEANGPAAHKFCFLDVTLAPNDCSREVSAHKKVEAEKVLVNGHITHGASPLSNIGVQLLVDRHAASTLLGTEGRAVCIDISRWFTHPQLIKFGAELGKFGSRPPRPG